MMHDCQVIQGRVTQYMFNELTEAEVVEVTAHLAECDSCEKEYDLTHIMSELDKSRMNYPKASNE
jgi:predicted anti-sigma-YlaC factor YlaD